VHDTTRERLDGYWAAELGCAPVALRTGGLAVCAPAHRDGPRWMGWLVPLEVITAVDAPQGTGVISTTSSLQTQLQCFLTRQGPRADLLPPEWWGFWPFIRAALPEISPRVHCVLAGDRGTFTPAPDVFPVTPLREDDANAAWFHFHFDGPVFAARDHQGVIAAWAAIKCKSDDVWEMAVVTEARYRGRGLARSVVSHATRAALDANKVALYLHEVRNDASAHVAHALGYHIYGHELTCEAGRIPPQSIVDTATRPQERRITTGQPFI
jgi:hypothetical protein